MGTAVGFAGLGNMGQAMARRLLEAGFDVSVPGWTEPRPAQRRQPPRTRKTASHSGTTITAPMTT